MKVQTKIALLLALLVAIFLGGLYAFRLYDRAKFRRIAEERYAERNKSFDDLLNHDGEALETLAIDYTCWDQMVAAIKTSDQRWFNENINDKTLDSFHAHAIWIFRPDGTSSFARPHSYLNSPELLQFPLPKEVIPQIFARGRLSHFYIKIPQGLMEIRAATVHPSKDSDRTTPPQGYFFAGRLWNNPVIKEMERFTGNEISVVPATNKPGELEIDELNGSMVFSRTLNAWDGKPLARLVIKNESIVVKEFNRESDRLFLGLFAFAVVVFLLLSVSLVLWVNRPLRQIRESLKRGDPAPIALLCKQNTEFGELARTVDQFFQQRANLVREMEERRATEEALRKSEDELRHSQKMEAVGRLAGGVAHDFNNLLTAIIGYAELLIGRSGTDPVVAQNADLIRKAGQQAAALTRQLLAFSRKQLLQPKVIDLNSLVVEMEKLLRRVIGERFELRTIPEAKQGRVKADRSQIEQVILNLGVNARDAMPKGGTLYIETANVRLDPTKVSEIDASLPPGDYVELSVTDTGEGMDEETKSRIFEPFFTTKGPGKGTGLGLATVYGIVRQSGGGITVETAVGKGSTFRIYLPVETAPVEQSKGSSAPTEETSHDETVLVAEDEEIVRQLVCDVLEEQGYQVLCAADGKIALEMAAKFDGLIDLLITDVIMPQMNGQELAIKLSKSRPDMKVLFVSGYSDNDIGDHGVLDSSIDLLQKPFTPHSLRTKIREVIEADGAAVTASETSDRANAPALS
jgi:signal transduction histidine kinase/FixJ family two-component response regulator